MRHEDRTSPAALYRLLRFLAIYGLALMVLLGALPAAGAFLEARYDALDTALRIALIAGLILTVVAWQALPLLLRQRRRRARLPGNGRDGEEQPIDESR